MIKRRGVTEGEQRFHYNWLPPLEQNHIYNDEAHPQVLYNAQPIPFFQPSKEKKQNRLIFTDKKSF